MPAISSNHPHGFTPAFGRWRGGKGRTAAPKILTTQLCNIMRHAWKSVACIDTVRAKLCLYCLKAAEIWQPYMEEAAAMNKKIGSDLGYATLIVSGAILILILSVDLFSGNSPFINIFMIAVIAIALITLWLAERDEREARKLFSDNEEFAGDRKTLSSAAKDRKSEDTSASEG